MGAAFASVAFTATVEVGSAIALGLFQVINGPASARDGGGVGAFWSLSLERIGL